MTGLDLDAVAAAEIGLAAIIAAACAFHIETTARHHGKSRRTALGLVLVTAGLYYFPLAQQSYQFTHHVFHLDDADNGLLWYAASAALLVLGILLHHAGRR